MPNLSERDVELAVNCLLEQMTAALASGERMEVRDFGSFALRHRPARKARNPKTGETVDLPSKAAIHFKPGKQLKERVNDARSQFPIKPL